MSHRLNGTSLFTQIRAGINNSYAIALQKADNNAGGISLNNIMSSLNSANNVNPIIQGNNTNFSSYLSTNFKGIDKNGDGKISTDELNEFTNKLYQKGLTQEELSLLCSYGSASETLQKVLDNFSKIDKNGDGRVTNAEISAFGIDEEVTDKKKEFMKSSAGRMSLFYSSSTTSDIDKV